MKRIAILAVVLGLSVLLNSCGEKIETVSAKTISELPPGKTFETDFTKDLFGRSTVYKFNDAGTDFTRVTIRTAAGVKNFGNLLKESNTSLKGALLLGKPGDMRNHLPTSTSPTTNYDCGSVTCQCEGSDDCADLIVSGKCDSATWCTEFYCYCDVKL